MLGVFRQWITKQHDSTYRSLQRLMLRCEVLEARDVPAGLFVAGVGGATQSADPEVSIYATVGPRANQQLGGQLEAFSGITGDTRIAFGDINADGTDDIIAAAGKGGGSQVVIFDGKSALTGNTSVLTSFFVYSDTAGASRNRGFDGGVFVAAADLNGDGFAELITTPGQGGRGHLKVFDFNSNSSFSPGPSPGSMLTIPVLKTSAYTFTDYDGEIRVATLHPLGVGDYAVVTASGVGVPGDVRGYSGARLYGMGQLPDLTSVPSDVLEFRLVPFGGYAGGLSVAGGSIDSGSSDELFISKNDGTSTVEVYGAFELIDNFSAGRPTPVPRGTFEAFAGFNGEVRLGTSDVDGDGTDEVLTTTGISGDSQGTPVKAWHFNGNSNGTGGTFTPVKSFYANPGYSLGAWLGGKDFTSAQDVTSTMTVRGTTGGGLPSTFSNGTGGRVDVLFGVPTDGVTGGGLLPKGLEVQFSFNHAAASQASVELVHVSPLGSEDTIPLFSGIMDANGVTTFHLTYSDDAGILPDGGIGAVNGELTARSIPQPLYNSIATFVRSQTNRAGLYTLRFSDTTAGTDGSVTADVIPRIRFFY